MATNDFSQYFPPRKPRNRKKIALIALTIVVLLFLVCGGAYALINWWVVRVHEAVYEVTSQNNMKQIVLGMYNLSDQMDGLPPALQSKDGKPGLSWRVALLPYVENDGLYREFKLDEPWDSPHNIKLLDKMPNIYATPGSEDMQVGATTTHYRIFVGNGAMFDRDKPLKIEEISRFDGQENTLALVEAAEGVPWTKPDDFEYDPNGPLPALGVPGRGRIAVCMADCRTFMVRRGLDPSHWHHAIQYRDGQNPGLEFFELKR